MYYADKLTKPFHACNAHTEHYKNMELFVSYQTPIATLEYDGDGCAHLLVSTAFRYSPTTIRQFSRWLREHGLSYHEVKTVNADTAPHKFYETNCIVSRGYRPSLLVQLFNAQ